MWLVLLFGWKLLVIFLNNLKIGRSGQVFIIERSGLLVASATKQQLFTLSQQKDAKPQRIKAGDSGDRLISATAQNLTQRFGDLSHVKKGQQLEFMLVWSATLCTSDALSR